MYIVCLPAPALFPAAIYNVVPCYTAANLDFFAHFPSGSRHRRARESWTNRHRDRSLTEPRGFQWGDWKRETWHRETIEIVEADIARLVSLCEYKLNTS